MVLTSDGRLEVGFGFATAANLIVACPDGFRLLLLVSRH